MELMIEEKSTKISEEKISVNAPKKEEKAKATKEEKVSVDSLKKEEKANANAKTVKE